MFKQLLNNLMVSESKVYSVCQMLARLLELKVLPSTVGETFEAIKMPNFELFEILLSRIT